MKKIAQVFSLAVTIIICLLLCLACKWDDSGATNEQSFNFDTGTVTCQGNVDPFDDSKGTIWDIHMTTAGDIEAHFVLVTEFNEDFVPAGTYVNSTTLQNPKVGTFLPGSTDKAGTPQYSFVITGTDASYVYYSILDNGTIKVEREVTTTEKGERKATYKMASQFEVFGTRISIGYNGELPYALYND